MGVTLSFQNFEFSLDISLMLLKLCHKKKLVFKIYIWTHIIWVGNDNKSTLTRDFQLNCHILKLSQYPSYAERKIKAGGPISQYLRCRRNSSIIAMVLGD